MTKTILITGSTDGIGKLVAKRFASEGYQVFLHGRNPLKLANVISEIKKQTNNNNVDGFIADFSDLKDVKKMAEEIVSKVSKLDILINNAGIFKTSATSKFKGYDIRLVVNYLAPYILTKTILQLLKNANQSRIINLSSAAQSQVTDGALAGLNIPNANEAYAQSKLALTMWSFHLAKQQKNINVIAVNPGSLLNTKMAIEAYGQHWSPAEKGSNILYDLSTDEAYKNDSGKYFDNDKGNPKGNFSAAHPDAYNEESISKLISKTEKIVTL